MSIYSLSILHTAVMCNRSVLMDPANGMVSVPSTMYLSVATYSCSVGFVILGNATRVCGADEMWSGEEPSCVRKCM